MDAFNALLAQNEDPSVAMDVIGGKLKSNILRGFDESANPFGVPWEPLKTRDGKPLVKDGLMRDSVSPAPVGMTIFFGLCCLHRRGRHASRRSGTGAIARDKRDAALYRLRTAFPGAPRGRLPPPAAALPHGLRKTAVSPSRLSRPSTPIRSIPCRPAFPGNRRQAPLCP